MPLKSLMKNPILAVGLLMMIIFLFQAGERFHWWTSRREKLTPSSCKAVLVMLQRRIPANWQASCEGNSYNNLAVQINIPTEKNEDLAKLDIQKLRKKMYRMMANDLISIAKNSPEDNLERTFIVRIRLKHKKLQIDAITEGKYLVKLQTLTDKTLIAEHLKVTVQVKETSL